MSGPPPKQAHLRQRTNKKAGAGVLQLPIGSSASKPCEIPNPDGRTWHRLTVGWWDRAWASAMASQWLESDADGLGRLAVLIDDFYITAEPTLRLKLAAEIRQEEQGYGLKPLDRTRLQWEVLRTEEAEHRLKAGKPIVKRASTGDPRAFLKGLK